MIVARTRLRNRHGQAVLWKEQPGPVAYGAAMDLMMREREKIIAGEAGEQVWLIESPAGYSKGAQADQGPEADQGVVADPQQSTAHAGGWWYHGPGVLGIVLLLDLRSRKKSIPLLVDSVNDWLIRSMQAIGADVHTGELPGIWATVGSEERKVAAVALSVKRWVTAYGAGINVDPKMSEFEKIHPCVLEPCMVASLSELGVDTTNLRRKLREEFFRTFGPAADAERRR